MQAPISKVEDRIRSLLAKSNGGTAAEYATAMRIAVKIANQHGVDLAAMAEDRAPEWTDPAAPAVIIEPKARAPKWERGLVQGLAKHLGCCAYSLPSRNAKGVRLVAQVAHGELGRVQTLRTLAQIWSAEALQRAQGERHRAAFLTGFVLTVLQRLAACDGTATPEPGALVSVDLAARALREVEGETGRMRTERSRCSAAAYGRGARAAQGATMPGEAAALRAQLALSA